MLSQKLRNLPEQGRRAEIVGRGDLGRAEHHGLLHALAVVHIGLAPLTKMEALVHQILVIRVQKIVRPGLLGTFFAVAHPAAHHVVILFQNRFVAVGFIQRPWDKNTGVAPAGRALQQVGDHAALVVHGGNVLHKPILPLGKTALAQPFAQDRQAVREIHRCRGEDARVARPARTLTGGAVGGNVAEVGAHAPETVQKKTVHIGVSAGKEPGLRHLGIDGDGGKFRVPEIHFRLDFRVAEAENGEGWLVEVLSVLADAGDFLWDAAFVAVARIKVLLGKIPVFVQGLAMPECNRLPGLRVNAQLGIAREILTKVDQRVAVWRGEELSHKTLLLQNGYALGRREVSVVKFAHGHTVPAADLFHPGVICFALLEIVFPRGSLLAGLPALIRAEDDLTVHLQLAEQGQIGAVVIAQTVDAHAAAIPAVAQRHG